MSTYILFNRETGQTLCNPQTDVPYVVGYKKENYKYELYGVCNHSGGVSGGHYTSYVKNANGKWYHYNDTSVTEVNNKESIVSPKAYVLFYRKKM